MKKKAKTKKRLTKAEIKSAVTKIYPEADFPPDRVTGCGGKGYFTP